MNKHRARGILLTALGTALSVIPPLTATLLYFPVWKSRGGAAMLSGFTLILILMTMVPFFRLIKKALSSPAAHTMWFIAFILFFILSEIAHEMTVISFTGFVGNAGGALVFRMAKKEKSREMSEDGEGV